MANFVPSKKEASDFNNGVQYVNNDIVQPSTINNLVESALYSQGVVEQNTTDIEESIEDINNSISTQFSTINQNLNTQIAEITSTANSAVTTANAANSKVDNFIASTDSPPPPVGYHYIQFSGESTPANRWAGTSWSIDTTYQGKTIIGSGGSYTVGSSGGSTSHAHGAGSLYACTRFNQYKQILYKEVSSQNWQSVKYISSTGNIASETATQNTATAIEGSTDTAGDMPPYKVVNIWKRTA